MLPRLLTAALLALPLAVVTPAAATTQQPVPVLAPAAPGKVQRLTLKDGSQLLGRIIAVDSTGVRFESAIGVSTIPVDAILTVREELPGAIREGRYFFPNPNATRLIFAPTGRMLARGEGYFSDYWVFFPGIAVGVSDRFTMGGGMSIFPGVGFDNQVYYVTPKIGVVQGPKFNLSVGALAAGVPSDDENNTVGVLYGVGSWGEPDLSFTAGLGYGFINDELADRPVAMVGGEARVSPRVSFVTENYSFPGGNMVLSGGLRFMGRDISVDFALADFLGSDENFCCLPFLGFVWKW